MLCFIGFLFNLIFDTIIMNAIFVQFALLVYQGMCENNGKEEVKYNV